MTPGKRRVPEPQPTAPPPSPKLAKEAGRTARARAERRHTVGALNRELLVGRWTALSRVVPAQAPLPGDRVDGKPGRASGASLERAPQAPGWPPTRGQSRGRLRGGSGRALGARVFALLPLEAAWPTPPMGVGNGETPGPGQRLSAEGPAVPGGDRAERSRAWNRAERGPRGGRLSRVRILLAPC